MNSTLSSYPLFPDWVFEGELQIDENVANSVLADVQSVRGSNNFLETNFGWCTNKNVRLGQNILKLEIFKYAKAGYMVLNLNTVFHK